MEAAAARRSEGRGQGRPRCAGSSRTAWGPTACTIIALGLAACGGTQAERAETSESTAPPAELGIPNEARPEPNVITGGQPSEDALRAAQASGVSTVVSLRTTGEPGSQGEAALVEALGMRFVSIPVAGADGVTEANARALDAAIREGSGDVLVHCGSSNRAGALMALRAFYVDGADLEAAIAAGKRAGLAGLEGVVREHLQAACAAMPERAC